MITKVEGEKKKTIIKDDQATTNIKGHLKTIDGFRQAKSTRFDLSSKSSTSSSDSDMMKLKLGKYKNSIQRSENTKKMENQPKNKTVIMNPKQKTLESTNNVEKMKMKEKKVWDCESTLYDSFELKSFNRQLDLAISSSARSMSMPHLSSSTPPPPPPPPTVTTSCSTKKLSPNKISRSLGKLIKSMFRHKQSTFKEGDDRVDMDKYYVVFDKTGTLTTIPESGESTEMVGSEINSLVRKTASERFSNSRLVGISCS